MEALANSRPGLKARRRSCRSNHAGPIPLPRTGARSAHRFPVWRPPCGPAVERHPSHSQRRQHAYHLWRTRRAGPGSYRHGTTTGTSASPTRRIDAQVPDRVHIRTASRQDPHDDDLAWLPNPEASRRARPWLAQRVCQAWLHRRLVTQLRSRSAFSARSNFSERGDALVGAPIRRSRTFGQRLIAVRRRRTRGSRWWSRRGRSSAHAGGGGRISMLCAAAMLTTRSTLGGCGTGSVAAAAGSPIARKKFSAPPGVPSTRTRASGVCTSKR